MNQRINNLIRILFHPFKHIKHEKEIARFRSRNYPVRIDKFPTGLERILVRNLDTHQYGGWYLDVKDVEREWGKDVVEMLRGNPKPTGRFL